MTAYIWITHKSEPGYYGCQLELTGNPCAPPRFAGVNHVDIFGHETDLAHVDTVYGDWSLLHTVNGDVFFNNFGPYIKRPDGEIWSMDEIAERYKFGVLPRQ